MNNLKTIDTRNLPENFSEVVAKFQDLKAQVDAIQQSLPHVGGSVPTLESARRDVLKAKLELEGLQNAYDETLGLDIVEAAKHAELLDVAQARRDAGTLYVECDSLLDVVKPALKALRGKAVGPVLENLENLNDEIKVLIKEVHGILRNIPELGMTFDEWGSLTMAERASLREPGRPSAPLEAKIAKSKMALRDSAALVNSLSNGELRDVEEIIKGVEMSKRGRPPASELNKLDRKLAHLEKRVREVTEAEAGKNSNSRDKKVARLLGQIEEIRAEIEEGEAELTEAEAAKRDLEKLRAKHRDMAVEEVHATGENQSALLLAIIRNEDAQLTAVDKILKLDPEARVTVTHKVNPKDTRQRFERLRLNGQMRADELEELSRLEHRQFTFAYSRNR